MDPTYLDDAMAHGDCIEQDKASLEKWNSISSTVMESDDSPSSGFDCNICLDAVQDAVVTLCGHLYCWPCIYKWLHFQSVAGENQYEQPQQQCPVCKAEISEATMVPLFGREQPKKSSKGKAPNLGIIIPRRPLSLRQACGFDSPRSLPSNSPRLAPPAYHQDSPQYQPYPTSPMISPGGTTANLIEPVAGIVREILYPRMFGNTITDMYSYPDTYHLAGSSSPRIRRHVMEADKSLSRIWFFLFCCVFLCFLSF